MNRGTRISLSVDDRAVLQRWVRAWTAPQRLVLRSRMILMLADGASGREVAQVLGVSRYTVDLWRARFREGGCTAIARDRPGRGRKRLAKSFHDSKAAQEAD